MVDTVDIDIVLDPLERKQEWMRYENRLKSISNKIGRKARGRVKQMRRENKKAQRLRDQATFEGSKAGLVASMMNETKYTTVENHVIRDTETEQ